MGGVELLSKRVGRERVKTTHTHTHKGGGKGVGGRGRGRRGKKGGMKEEVVRK